MFKFNIKVNSEHVFKAVVNNTFEFVSKVANATVLKLIVIHTRTYFDSEIINRIVFKTKVFIKSMASSTVKGMLKCKARTNHVLNYTTTMSGKLKSKIHFDNNYYSDAAIKFIGNMLGRFSDGATSNVDNSHALLQAKITPKEKVTSSHSTKNYIHAKMKIGTLSKTNMALLSYRVKSKKLSAYTDTKLSDLPPRLKNFCFYLKSDNWEEAQSSYTTWGDLKMNTTTWEDFIK